jgi:membrane carboxypeptidase/penicillin-binding protein
MKRVAPASLTYVMNDILKDVVRQGTAAGVRSRGFERPFAGKTGTTNDYRDAWFIGYSPRILTLVWLGFDDNHTLRLSGSDAAVPVWASYMNTIIGTVPEVDFKRPDTVVEREIDSETGMLATPWCPHTRLEVYVRSTEPKSTCDLHSGGYEPFSLPDFRDETPGEDRPGVRADRDDRGEEPPAKEEKKKKKRKWWERIFGD